MNRTFPDRNNNERVVERMRAYGFISGPVTATHPATDCDEISSFLDENYLEETAIWYDRHTMWIMAKSDEIIIEAKLKFDLISKSV